MLSEEKAKNKGKPSEKWPLSAFLLPLIACIVICGASWLIFTRHSSDVPLLDGLSSGEQAEAAILVRVPLGSSRAEVESFIAEEFQLSNRADVACDTLDEHNPICIMAFGKAGLCGHMVWYFEIRFENELLTEIIADYGAGCR